MGSVCQTCGDTGWKDLLLCCTKCQISTDHRYCLAEIPKPDDEEFTYIYICPRCVLSSGNRTSSKLSFPNALHPRPSHRRKHRRQTIHQPAALVQDLEKIPANSSSSLTEVEAEVQTHDVSPSLQTSVSQPSVKDVLPQADLNENNRSPGRVDKPAALVQVLENRWINNSSSIVKVVAEVEPHDVPPSLQTPVSDPFVKVVLPEADLNENNGSPPCCDVNNDGDQELQRKRRRLIPNEWGKSDEQVEGVEGQKPQVVPVAQVGPVDNCGGLGVPSPHPLVEYPNNVFTQPIIDPTWRGCFEICREKKGRFVAHLSNKACLKVVEAAKLMPALLRIKMMPRLEAWPKNFNASAPTDENIALYFFPGSESAAKDFDNLTNHIIDNNLVLKILFDNVELLILPSNQLPPRYCRFNGKNYMWGLFRGRKNSLSHESGDSQIIQNSSTECSMPSSGLGVNNKSNSTESSRMSPLSPLSMSGSYSSNSPRSPLL